MTNMTLMFAAVDEVSPGPGPTMLCGLSCATEMPDRPASCRLPRRIEAPQA